MKLNQNSLFQIWTGKYYSFMIVRHPFERVLSAYRDRILRKDSSQAIRHIPRIFRTLKVFINKYQSKTYYLRQNKFGSTFNLTFQSPQDSRAKFDTSRLFDRETEELTAIPSFEEFLRYITSDSSNDANQDPHWQTYK